MLFSIVALIILFHSRTAQASCISNNHVRPADIVADEVNKIFEEKNYKKLDELARQYERERRSTFDSQSSLMAFYNGIAYGFNSCAKTKKSEDEWAAHRQALIAWMDASPNSTAAKLALALFSIDYGWHGRGSGYASTVDEKSWAVFKERISSAKSQLDELAAACNRNPAWYAGMLYVALAQGWTPDAFEALYQKAVQIDPYYISIHYTSSEFYSERWYGSNEQQQAAIERAVKLTRKRLGEAMYARLHWTFSSSNSMFTDGNVSWKRMKEGFEDSLRIYPDDRTRNNYAKFACAADDTETLKEQLTKLGNRVEEGAWGSKYFYTYCKTLVKLAGTGKRPQCFQRADTGEVFCE